MLLFDCIILKVEYWLCDQFNKELIYANMLPFKALKRAETNILLLNVPIQLIQWWVE